jgi:hypothetical protein
MSRRLVGEHDLYSLLCVVPAFPRYATVAVRIALRYFYVYVLAQYARCSQQHLSDEYVQYRGHCFHARRI